MGGPGPFSRVAVLCCSVLGGRAAGTGRAGEEHPRGRGVDLGLPTKSDPVEVNTDRGNREWPHLNDSIKFLPHRTLHKDRSNSPHLVYKL